MAKQGKSLEDRFRNADSVLVSTPTETLKPKTGAKPAAAPKAKAKPAAVQIAETETELVVRDTFSMPQSDHAQIGVIRSKAAMTGRIFTKSEVVRSGLQALADMEDGKLVRLLDSLERMKPERKR